MCLGYRQVSLLHQSVPLAEKGGGGQVLCEDVSLLVGRGHVLKNDGTIRSLFSQPVHSHCEVTIATPDAGIRDHLDAGLIVLAYDW